MFKKLKAIWDLTRLEHGIIYAISFIVSLVIAYKGWPDPTVTIAGLIAITAAEMGTFALNDYFDVEVDIRNKRTDRPIVRGDITKQEALIITVITLIVSVIAGYFIGNIGALIVLVVLMVFGILYDYKLKEYGIWGNLYIAFTMAAPFLFGSMLFKSSMILLLLAAIAFFVGLGREIMKGIMDVEGDALRDVKTIARVYGEKSAKYSAVALYILAILLSPLPFFTGFDIAYQYDLIFALFSGAAGLLLLYVCYTLLRSHDVKTIGRARKTTLIAMLLALIAFLVPALI